MTLIFRKNDPYLDAKVEIDRTIISIGLLNRNECSVIAETLRQAVQDLEHFISTQPPQSPVKE